jgi:hypothetical protein
VLKRLYSHLSGRCIAAFLRLFSRLAPNDTNPNAINPQADGQALMGGGAIGVGVRATLVDVVSNAMSGGLKAEAECARDINIARMNTMLPIRMMNFISSSFFDSGTRLGCLERAMAVTSRILIVNTTVGLYLNRHIHNPRVEVDLHC